jgi:hypothetical protein
LVESGTGPSPEVRNQFVFAAQQFQRVAKIIRQVLICVRVLPKLRQFSIDGNILNQSSGDTVSLWTMKRK